MNKKLLILISIALITLTACQSNPEEKKYADNFNACYSSLTEEKPIEACNELEEHLSSYISKAQEDNKTLDEALLSDNFNKLQTVIDISQNAQIRSLTQSICDQSMDQLLAFDPELNIKTYRSITKEDKTQADKILKSFLDDSNFQYLETISISQDYENLENMHTAYLYQDSDGIQLSIVIEDDTPIQFIFDQHNQTLNKLVFAKEVTHVSKFIYQYVFNNDFFEAEKMAQNIYMLILKEEDTQIDFDNTSNYVSGDRIIIKALNQN